MPSVKRRSALAERTPYLVGYAPPKVIECPVPVSSDVRPFNKK